MGHTIFNCLVVQSRLDKVAIRHLQVFFSEIVNERGEFAIASSVIEVIKKLWRLYGLPESIPTLLSGYLEAESELHRISAYRGHLIHQFQVFLVGFIVLAECPGFRKRLVNHLGVRESVLKCWLITACLHDIATPIGMLSKWACEVAKVALPERFSFEESAEDGTPEDSGGFDGAGFFRRSKKSVHLGYPVETTIFPHFLLLQRDYRRLSEHIAYRFMLNENGVGPAKPKRTGDAKNIKAESVEFLSKALLDAALLSRDHGVLSALVVATSLLSESNGRVLAKWPTAVNPKGRLDGIGLGLMLECCEAIALHDGLWERFKAPVMIEKHPLAFLLFYADNLQQWGRPRLEETPFHEAELLTGSTKKDGAGYTAELLYPPVKGFLRVEDKKWKEICRYNIEPMRDAWTSSRHPFEIVYRLASGQEGFRLSFNKSTDTT